MPDTAVRPIVFLDFDGTISRADVVDAILERYALDGWRDIEQAWQAGRIGSRECLREQIALVRATPAELEALVDSIGVDPGIRPLVETCRYHHVDLHIVSDGFDLCIHRLLQQTHIAPADVAVYSSRLTPVGANQWSAAFTSPDEGCEHGCATCKPRVMRSLNPQRRPVVFVGDGLSDRYAAEAADVVFAKDRLRTYCGERGLPHLPFDALAEVTSFINNYMRLGQPWRQPAAAPAGA
jgi:2,3-diketo-5-methylthio-1-phosphopentane phosphatase